MLLVAFAHHDALPHPAVEMSHSSRPTFSKIQFIAGLLAVILLAGVFMAWAAKIGASSRGISNGIANCRQIILALRLYAADNAGAYPDSKGPAAEDSNTAFKRLIVGGILEEEELFGCAPSPFKPDGSLGEAPGYAETLEPGENHWAMTKGLTDQSPGGMPLVYENPAEASWPPTWNADAAGTPVFGRAWKSGTHCMVIIGCNDTSVEAMELASCTGTQVPLAAQKNPFAAAGGEVLDVAEK